MEGYGYSFHYSSASSSGPPFSDYTIMSDSDVSKLSLSNSFVALGGNIAQEQVTDHHEVKSGRKKEENTISKKMKKPRYAFQTRSRVDILDDGYRWRKYGQKAVKNNRFPRVIWSQPL